MLTYELFNEDEIAKIHDHNLRAKARMEGEDRMGQLAQRLLQEQKYDKLALASSDAGYRAELFLEYGL